MGISKQGKGCRQNIAQALSFYAARLFTLFVDLIIMFLLVNLPGIEVWSSSRLKVFSNIVVLVLNYVFSKVFVFRKEKKKEEDKN